MDILSLQNELKVYSEIIINPDSFYGDVKNAIEKLHALFVQCGAIDGNVENLNDEGTFLPGGLALSPIIAARCAFDLARTRTFVQGITKAFKALRRDQNPLQILYAGCGPYALLAVLSTPFFNPKEIQFTLLDIHQESLTSCRNIIKAFGLEEYFAEINVSDATKYTWKNETSLDVILFETMQPGLKKETQVTIAANLIPQLAIHGIMLPQNVEVKVVLVHEGARNALRMGIVTDNSNEDQIVLGTILSLNKNTALKIAGNEWGSVKYLLPAYLLKSPYVLELQTIVTVWENAIIKDNESAITMPVKLTDAQELKGKTYLELEYVNGKNPGIIWKAL